MLAEMEEVSQLPGGPKAKNESLHKTLARVNSKKSASQASANGPAVMEIEKLLVPAAHVRGMYLVRMEWIQESAKNERQHYDAGELVGLGASMREMGMINTEAGQAYWVEDEQGRSRFELSGGHRRFRALKLIGAQFMKLEIQAPPASVKDERKKRMLLNLQRVDLTPLEEADAWRALMKEGAYTSVELMAKDMGFERRARSIRDMLSLEKLDDAVRVEVERGNLTASHAVILAREKPGEQVKLMKECAKRKSWQGGGLVSEKEFRDRISQHHQREKWEAERQAKEEKEAKAKAAAKETGKKTAEQIAAQREREKTRAKNEKERAEITAAMNELLAPYEAGGDAVELPTEVLRILAIEARFYGEHEGGVVEKRLNVPASAYKREPIVEKLNRAELIQFLVAAVGLSARAAYDKTRQRRHKTILAELTSKPAKAKDDDDEVGSIGDEYRRVVINQAIETIFMTCEASRKRWAEHAGTAIEDSHLAQLLNNEIAGQLGHASGDVWTAKYGEGKALEDSPWVQITAVNQTKPFCTLRDAELFSAARRVFKIKPGGGKK